MRFWMLLSLFSLLAVAIVGVDPGSWGSCRPGSGSFANQGAGNGRSAVATELTLRQDRANCFQLPYEPFRSKLVQESVENRFALCVARSG